MDDDILIGDSEIFEDVRPCLVRHDFPAIKFFRNRSTLVAYFNRLASPMLGNADNVRVMVSTRFIVFLPSSNIYHNRIRRRVYNDRTCDVTVSVARLRGMVPEGVWFRCYLYKSGIAIKRDEPIMQAKGEV